MVALADRAARPAPRTTHLVVGPAEHGVTRYALQQARADVGADVVRVPQRLVDTELDDVLRRLPGPAGRVHLHVTEHLLGRAPAEAAGAVARIAAHTPTTLTLHDLPPATDRHGDSRSRAYASMAVASDGVVVCSHHELALLEAVLAAHARGHRVRTAVVPHAVDQLPTPAGPVPGPGAPRDLGILGFVYPGKGHADVLAAAAAAGPDVGVVAMGRPSPGHVDLLADLQAGARAAGLRFRCTGWLDDDALHRLLARVAVPVVAHRDVSASGSLATWMAAGRRPVALRNRYVEEVAARSPGAVAVVDDLLTGVRDALADPETTWRAADVVVGPTPAAAAAQLAAVLGSWR